MKAIKLWALALATLAITACSKETGGTKDSGESAIISVHISGNASRATGEESAITIKNLQILVFKTSGEKVAYKFKEEAGGVDKIEDIEVPAGSAYHVVAIGNAFQPDGTSMLDLKDVASRAALTNKIENIANQFTSANQTVTGETTTKVLKPGKNYLGYEGAGIAEGTEVDTEATKKFEIKRIVAKVTFKSITTETGTNRVRIDKYYILNAKNQSLLLPASGETRLVVDATDNFKLGYIPSNGGAGNLSGPLYPGYTGPGTGAVAPTAADVVANLNSTDGNQGEYFYLFENNLKTGETNLKHPTLLVLEATWTNAQGDSKTVYYPITINKTYAGSTGTADNYIVRNNRYDIDVTIKGEGTTNPWFPADAAILNVKVTVKDWETAIVQNVTFE